MNIKLGLILYMCLAPFLIMMLVVLYPKNWKKKKIFFGINNREEFKMGDTEAKVDEIVQRNRRLARWIIIPEIIIGAILIFIPNMTVMAIVYTAYLLIAFIICDVPYIKGNAELKSLKKELGIESKGVKVADLKSISAAHALNMPMLLLPNILAAVCMVFALLYDFKVIYYPGSELQGSFAATTMAGSYLFMSILFVILAIVADNMRNVVISEDSGVNANYNRAKKMIWNNLWIQMSWLNTAMILIFLIIIVTGWSEAAILISSVIYMVGIVVILGILAYKTALLSECYKFENELNDEDDNWIYGLFYYNPRDGRLNVERRDGMGMTINMANPIGKIITAVVALIMIGVVATLIWVGMLEATDIDLKLENGNVICHHLRDEYVIPVNEISELSIGDDLYELHPVRIAGVATDDLLKGSWSVGEDKKVKMFVNPTDEVYIRIRTADSVYYISDNTAEETQEVYDAVYEQWAK